VIYKQEDIQLVREEYRDAELDQAIQEDRLIEYILEDLYGNSLTLEEQFTYKQEILSEEVGAKQIAGLIGVSPESLDNMVSVQKCTNMIDRLNDKERKAEDDLDRARAEEKGKFAVIVNMIKKAIAWLKRKLLRIKDSAMDMIKRSPNGYHAAVRGYGEVIKRETSPDAVKKRIMDAQPKKDNVVKFPDKT
jgi:citrate synthase